ncbi:MAG: hypothetical protein DMD34_10920 [Gemmatimonadetes bacterium]|nr:MAG: hypothetical protein DMD46_02960 [Gemmatimonadota bacterium]PYP93842.1 MAG: hypothetical protein DMD34_10920 [Gemmatimonadota bacterium]
MPTIPVAVLRDAVALAITELSLRGAAKEMGISPNGLRNFINGSAPRSATRAKLERWLASLDHRTVPPPTVGHLVRLLTDLSGDLSPQQTVLLGRSISAVLADAYEARRLSPPRWVQDLLRHYRPRRAKESGETA